MTEATVESFRTRLDQLEHENRRLKNIGALLLLVLGALAVMGQAPGGRAREVLEVQRLVLVDSAGKRRADLRLSPEGHGHVALFDDSGPRTITIITPGGISFYAAPPGRARIWMRIRDDGDPTASMTSAAGREVWGAPHTVTPVRLDASLTAPTECV
jgi:hypothetical protein